MNARYNFVDNNTRILHGIDTGGPFVGPRTFTIKRAVPWDSLMDLVFCYLDAVTISAPYIHRFLSDLTYPINSHHTESIPSSLVLPVAITPLPSPDATPRCRLLQAAPLKGVKPEISSELMPSLRRGSRRFRKGSSRCFRNLVSFRFRRFSERRGFGFIIFGWFAALGIRSSKLRRIASPRNIVSPDRYLNKPPGGIVIPRYFHVCPSHLFVSLAFLGFFRNILRSICRLIKRKYVVYSFLSL